MKKEILLCILILTSVVSIATPTASAQADTVTLLWSIEFDVYDIAVSKDGRYIAVTGSYEGAEQDSLLYFDSSNPEPIWHYETNDYDDLYGVAISADGNEVVVGEEEWLLYFNESRSRTGDQNGKVTWQTDYLGGDIETDCLDMSDDGEYVAAGGTGWSVFYFADCANWAVRNSSDLQGPTWYEWPYYEVLTLDLSSNGKYLVVGTGGWPDGEVIYYKDAWNYDPSDPQDLNWTFSCYEVLDVAVSDDGLTVSAVDTDYLNYWTNALTLSDDPPPTWFSNYDYRRMDMSSTGDEVFVGDEYYDTVFFMSDASTKEESIGPEDFNWQQLQDFLIYDVALSDDGYISVATAGYWNNDNFDFDYFAYFFRSDGTIIGSYPIPRGEYDYFITLSMSGSGNIVAIGTEPDSDLYVFYVEYSVGYFSVTLDPSITSYLVEEINLLDGPRKVSVYVEVEPNGMEFGDQFVVFATLLQNGTWKVLANDYSIINDTEDGDFGMQEVLLIWDQLPVAEGMQIWVVRTGTEETGDSETLTFQVIIHDFGEDKLDEILGMLKDNNTGLVEIKDEVRKIEHGIDTLQSVILDTRDSLMKINNTIVSRLYWMSDNYTVSLTNVTNMLEAIYNRLGIPVGGLIIPLQLSLYAMTVFPYLIAVLAGLLAVLLLARRMGRGRG